MRLRPSLGWTPWILGGVLGLALAASFFRPLHENSFERLYERIIAAGQAGDQATVLRLMPLALRAFAELPEQSVDARYHLAMLRLHVGDLPGARAQADSIQAAAPEHLFGWVVQAAVARWTRDRVAQAQAWRRFLERYDAELATGKAEYREHRAMLEEVRKAARAS